MKLTYLDYAATTPTDLKVFNAMKPFFKDKFGNASEPHFLGVQALTAIEKARDQIIDLLNSKNGNIIFTGSATESINLSHKGLIESLLQNTGEKKLHIITSAIEHKAVLETCRHLEALGKVDVTYLPVDSDGNLKISDIEDAIRPETVLVSVMYVNNEVGTIQPIEEIGALIKKVKEFRQQKKELPIYFHTDATQAIQYLNCDVDYLGVDMLSFTGHKIYAPKGIGALYIRKRTPITRQLDGGRQESGLRAGTENVPYIVGLGEAVELIVQFREKEIKRLMLLQEKLINKLLEIPGVTLTGSLTERAPHIASFLIEGVEGEALILLLSDKGIISSTGSACNSGDLQPSHVLSAMGIIPENSHGSIRFSLGRNTCEEDIDRVGNLLPGIIAKLRNMAPKFSIGSITYG